MSDYLRTDTAEDTAASLEVAVEFLDHAASDDRYWKWFIHAIHSSVQNTLALALDGGNGFLVQKPGVMKRMLKAHATGGAPVEPNMDNFLRLFDKALRPENLRAGAIPLTDNGHSEALRSLNDLRDGFAHFNVKSWSIEKLLIAERSRKVLDIVDHYVNKAPSIFWHEDSHHQRVSAATQTLISKLARLCNRSQAVALQQSRSWRDRSPE